MRVKVFRPREHALTLPEVLLVTGVLVIIALMLPGLVPARSSKSRHRSVCTSNLRQIGLAMRMFSHDHYDSFPWAVPKAEGGSMEYSNSWEVFRHFLAVSNGFLFPKVLKCPTDPQRTLAKDWSRLSNKNISYFLGVDADEGRPHTILAGDRTLSLNGTNVVGLMTLQEDSNLGLSKGFHDRAIHVVLRDGSAHVLSENSVTNWMRDTNAWPLRLAIP